MEETIQPRVGMMLFGYCNGYFGRDGYDDKRVEFVAHDYIVVRTDSYDVQLLNTSKWDGHILKVWTEEEESYD